MSYLKYGTNEYKIYIIENIKIIIEIKEEKNVLYLLFPKISNWGVSPIKSKLYIKDFVYLSYLLIIN